MLLTDLDVAVRKSGLVVIELPGWRTNESPGGFDPKGVLCHHTGSLDVVGDSADDLLYAKWLGNIGRSDLPPPLCNLALAAEGVVFVCSAGNANHAGEAKATGPMPHADEGNALYIGIEAMNSGSQGWGCVGIDARGEPVTQYNAYARLCAALCEHYGWPASHVRAHWETSVTGKWDPGDPGSGAGPDGRSMDMNAFRVRVGHYLTNEEDDMPMWSQWPQSEKDEFLKDIANAVWKFSVDKAGTTAKSMLEAAGRLAKRTLGE